MTRFQSLVTLCAALSVAVSANAFAAKAEKKAKAQATASKIEFDPSASVMKWEGKKVTGQHDGEIKLKKGEVTFAGKELKGGEFEIDMASIVDHDVTDATYKAKLENHLKSEDFFDVAKFPVAVLKIKEAKSVEGFVGPTWEVKGDLTIKGKTNEVTFPVVIDTKEGKTTAKANITIDRTKWDIRYGSGKFFKNLGDKMINDEFKLDVALATK